MSSMARRLTITDVALAAGVSVATISKVINDRDGIATGTSAGSSSFCPPEPPLAADWSHPACSESPVCVIGVRGLRCATIDNVL